MGVELFCDDLSGLECMIEWVGVYGDDVDFGELFGDCMGLGEFFVCEWGVELFL